VPELITKVVPEYPEVARKAGIQGTVILSCLIDVSGNVQDIKVVQSIPILNDSAVAGVRQWKYRPAKRKGHPAAVHTTIHVTYDLGKTVSAQR
jgi:protein TonB